MSWRGVHRWLAIVLVAPLIVWSITGLLFHLKPGWGRAYDMLDVERSGPPLHAEQLGGLPPFHKLEVFDTALGLIARETTDAGMQLIDDTGKLRSPLSVADATTLVADAIARSPHHDAYGPLGEASTTADTVRFQTAHAVVEIGRTDARISQRGADTDRIDWLYRIHYLQWTGNTTIDRILAVVGLALIWAVLIPGIVLFVRRTNPHEPEGPQEWPTQQA